MSDLAHKKCIPCEGGVEKLTPAEATEFLKQTPDWTLNESSTMISRKFPFKDFAGALAFTNKIAVLAEGDWHHPTIELSWGNVEVRFSTHSIRGLSENDFIVAAKIDKLEK